MNSLHLAPGSKQWRIRSIFFQMEMAQRLPRGTIQFLIKHCLKNPSCFSITSPFIETYLNIIIYIIYKSWGRVKSVFVPVKNVLDNVWKPLQLISTRRPWIELSPDNPRLRPPSRRAPPSRPCCTWSPCRRSCGLARPPRAGRTPSSGQRNTAAQGNRYWR